MNTRAFPTLLRREIWEHRALWMAPLSVAVLYVLVCMLPIDFGPRGIDAGGAGGGTRNALPLLAMQLAFTAVLYGLMWIVVFFYLADCLFAERRDRSILFWKSLPVSDSATVLSKLAVAMLVVPLGVYVLALVANLVAFGILYVRFQGSPGVGGYLYWDSGAWLRMNGLLAADVIILALWYAPIAAYQLLVSAWAKSSVLVWTILPPLVAIFGERLVFGSWNLADLIGRRLGVNFSALASAPVVRLEGVEGLLWRINGLGLLRTAELWIGVLVAAALVFGAVRIRRFRDES